MGLLADRFRAQMAKNIKFLYSKLCTEDFNGTGDLANWQNNKAASTHRHTTSNSPISSTRTNSYTYIPTSSLIDSTNQTCTSLNGYHTITGTTKLYPDNKLNNIISHVAVGIKYRYVFDSISDVDKFCNTYNHNNNYDGLNIGDEILINDGAYNTIWKIAGFDCEYNRVASDNTTYDNGYGICLIPKTNLGTTMAWNSADTVVGGYKSSTMHTSNLVTVANNLQSVLGSHLVLRNVLLSSKTNGTSPRNNISSNYTWTTSYATLMSVGQVTGTFGSNWNKYDDGEANYKLPLFDNESYSTGSNYWLRSVRGYISGDYYAWSVISDGSITYNYVANTRDVRPLIYIR